MAAMFFVCSVEPLHCGKLLYMKVVEVASKRDKKFRKDEI